MARSIISTDKAPQAIGTYSQAVKIDQTVYLSGQISLFPETMELVEGDMRAQITQVFNNLTAVAEAAGGSLSDSCLNSSVSLIRQGRLLVWLNCPKPLKLKWMLY
jgi:reactive intermediate/imine deaminase